MLLTSGMSPAETYASLLRGNIDSLRLHSPWPRLVDLKNHNEVAQREYCGRKWTYLFESAKQEASSLQKKGERVMSPTLLPGFRGAAGFEP